MLFRSAIEFPNPVYFAFKVTQTPNNRATSSCGAWVDNPPAEPGYVFFVGMSRDKKNERAARDGATRTAKFDALKSVAATIPTINGQPDPNAQAAANTAQASFDKTKAADQASISTAQGQVDSAVAKGGMRSSSSNSKGTSHRCRTPQRKLTSAAAWGGKRALATNIVVDLERETEPMPPDGPFHLRCQPEEAAKRLKTLAALGFDDAVLVSRHVDEASLAALAAAGDETDDDAAREAIDLAIQQIHARAPR